MIKVAITNADTTMGGTLIRLLLNHPDVELVAAVAPMRPGQPVAEIHPGLTGDTSLRFTADGAGVDADVLFLVGNAATDVPTGPETHIIDTTGTHSGEDDYIQGIPELERKRMVRGGRHVALPPAAAVPVTLSLLPLARNLLLHGTVRLVTDADIFGERETAGTIEALSQLQNSLDLAFDTQIIKSAGRRALHSAVTVACNLDDEHIKEVFDKYYDDHNFVFRTETKPSDAEVINTNKCLLYVDTDRPDFVTVHAVIDPEIKGGAGNAIHAMNLLEGLHERIGLQLTPLGPVMP